MPLKSAYLYYAYKKIWHKQLTKKSFFTFNDLPDQLKTKIEIPFFKEKFIICPKINNVSKIRDEGFVANFFLYLMSLALYFYLKKRRTSSKWRQCIQKWPFNTLKTTRNVIFEKNFNPKYMFNNQYLRKIGEKNF